MKFFILNYLRSNHVASCSGLLLYQSVCASVTEFAHSYIHMDAWSVLCQLSTSSGLTWLKEIFLEDTILLEVTTSDAHLRLHLPPSFTQDTILVK